MPLQGDRVNKWYHQWETQGGDFSSRPQELYWWKNQEQLHWWKKQQQAAQAAISQQQEVVKMYQKFTSPLPIKQELLGPLEWLRHEVESTCQLAHV